MAVGLGVFGLRPADFWQLTGTEWQAMLTGWQWRQGINLPHTAPLSRLEFLALKQGDTSHAK